MSRLLLIWCDIWSLLTHLLLSVSFVWSAHSSGDISRGSILTRVRLYMSCALTAVLRLDIGHKTLTFLSLCCLKDMIYALQDWWLKSSVCICSGFFCHFIFILFFAQTWEVNSVVCGCIGWEKVPVRQSVWKTLTSRLQVAADVLKICLLYCFCYFLLTCSICVCFVATSLS